MGSLVTVGVEGIAGGTVVQVLQNELHSELSPRLPGEDCHDRDCPW